MKRPLFFALFAVVTHLSGCSHFRKEPTIKESSTIAAETDENMRQRFVDRRASELVAQGVTAEAARTQAAAEYKARYSYTSSAKK
jgi:hypothetical protein